MSSNALDKILSIINLLFVYVRMTIYQLTISVERKVGNVGLDMLVLNLE